MDQLMAMRAFTRVVESGNFTRAADSLNMPIATLSKLVKSLEAHLAIRLLHRTTRRVVTTPEGLEYYEKARRVLIDIEDIDTSFRVSRATPKGHLRVDVGGSTARDVLIWRLPRRVWGSFKPLSIQQRPICRRERWWRFWVTGSLPRTRFTWSTRRTGI